MCCFGVAATRDRLLMLCVDEPMSVAADEAPRPPTLPMTTHREPTAERAKGTHLNMELRCVPFLSPHFGNLVTYGLQVPGVGGAILPDIMDYDLGQIGEIKPLSPYGIATGESQIRAATSIANGLAYTYRGERIQLGAPVPHYGPQGNWIASNWQPGIQVIWPGQQNPLYSRYVAITLGNINGLIYYHRIRLPNSAVLGLAAQAAVEQFAVRVGEQMIGELRQGLRGGFDPAAQLIWQYRVEALMFAAVAGGAGFYGQAVVSKVRSLQLSFHMPIPALALGL